MKKLLFTCLFPLSLAASAQSIQLRLDLTKPGPTVSSSLYGLMTEEINHSYDGGLYAELVRNRIFKDDPKSPAGWSAVGDATIQLDQHQHINDALTTCIKLQGKGGLANEGYWGIPVWPGTAYKASFYAKAEGADAKTEAADAKAPGAPQVLTVTIESKDGRTTYASGTVQITGNGWKKYEVTLHTQPGIDTTTNTRLVLSPSETGTYWFNLVSLFPPTYNNRAGGNRRDIMQLLADMKPSFLRLPGGNYLEGDFFDTRFAWKKTLGPLEDRPGHPGCWSYRSSDGMGLLEFLEWCEDLKMKPLLAVNAGYNLRGDHMDAGPYLKPFVDEALEEIEYVIGDVHTKWGAIRAADGHPRPFPLEYVEVGNEDGFDRSGSYDARFAQFYDAIRAKYPRLKVISTIGGRDVLGSRFPLTSRKPDAIDEHYYRTAVEMEEDADHYDNYDRKGAKIFVGEWATREGSPTTNMNAALGDAAWMTGMERNADLVVMSCYAPLFVNVNPGGMQWKSDLIGFDAMRSYGSPSYYAQKLFKTYLGDHVVPVTGENIPQQTDSTAKKPFPAVFYVATRDSKKVYLKVVNTTGTAQPIHIEVKGRVVSPDGELVVLKSSKPGDTNTIEAPENIVPQVSAIHGLGNTIDRVLDPYSISVIILETGGK